MRRTSAGQAVGTLGATVVVLLGISCQSAVAGTVAVEHKVEHVGTSHGGYIDYPYAEITYTAAAGERNDVTTTGLDAAASIKDAGASVVAGTGCEQISTHEARCSATESIVAAALLRDGDDTARLVSAPGSRVALQAKGGGGHDALFGPDAAALLVGGRGNDVLRAGSRSGARNRLLGQAGDDTLVGGPHVDEIVGGGGSDQVYGRAGDDRLHGDAFGATPGSDTIDGGPGRSDMVFYDERSKPVDVDLRRSHGNGQAGEQDHLVGVEDVVGGGASDRIAGDEGNNYLGGASWYDAEDIAKPVPGAHDILIGRGGNDVLEGKAGGGLLAGGRGDDLLMGGGGGVRYRGGPGSDGFEIWDSGAPADIECGGGEDRLHFVRPKDVFPSSCEEVQLIGAIDLNVFTRLTRAARDSVAMHVTLFSNEEAYCRAAIRLFAPARRHAGRTLLGRGIVRLRKVDRKERVLVRLTRLGRRLLVAGRRVAVEVEGRGLDGCRPGFGELGKPYPDFTVVAQVRGRP